MYIKVWKKTGGYKIVTAKSKKEAMSKVNNALQASQTTQHEWFSYLISKAYPQG